MVWSQPSCLHDDPEGFVFAKKNGAPIVSLDLLAHARRR